MRTTQASRSLLLYTPAYLASSLSLSSYDFLSSHHTTSLLPKQTPEYHPEANTQQPIYYIKHYLRRLHILNPFSSPAKLLLFSNSHPLSPFSTTAAPSVLNHNAHTNTPIPHTPSLLSSLSCSSHSPFFFLAKLFLFPPPFYSLPPPIFLPLSPPPFSSFIFMFASLFTCNHQITSLYTVL